jgi:aminopeptidase N
LFNIKILIDSGYKIINSKKSGDYSVLEQSIPDSDCSIIASNSFNCVQSNFKNITVNIYFTKDIYNNLAQKIRGYLITILDYYKRFGEIDCQELSIVIAPREEGGGYCRPGLIVLMPNDDNKNEADYFKFIAHEIAHLWWCKCKRVDSWEDWLNESFAEFSALLVLREAFGEEEFKRKINLYAQKAEGLPPIKGLDRDNEKAYSVLYMKGPLILHELEENIGILEFEKLLNIVHVSNVDTTEYFLHKLNEITNQEITENFNMLLVK